MNGSALTFERAPVAILRLQSDCDSGVDWSALGRATWLDLRGANAEFGGSTITMQLVRILAKTPRSLTGKLACVVNCAGLVTFNPSLELAISVNTQGARHAAEHQSYDRPETARD